MLKLMLACLLVPMLLVGCAKRGNVRLSQIDETRGITQRVLVTDQQEKKLTKSLRDAGIGVISVGQDYKLVIPASSIYVEGSPRIRWSAYSTLNAVANYLKQYRKEQLKVVAFVKRSDDKPRDIALAKTRANKMIDYLWSQSLDATFVYGTGFAFSNADRKLVQGDLRQLSRVELSFRNTIA